MEYYWQEELKRHGADEASLQRVVWKFMGTRVIVNILLYLTSLTFGFLAPVSVVLQ